MVFQKNHLSDQHAAPRDFLVLLFVETVYHKYHIHIYPHLNR